MKSAGLFSATALASVLLCTGCPFSDIRLQLDYTPASATCAAAGRSVHVARVKDGRQERFRIGVKKNGYGKETARDFLSADKGIAPEWAYRALVGALRAAGLEVTARPGPKDELIMVTLKQFFVEPRIDAWYLELHGVVLMELEVHLSDGRRYARLIRGYWSDMFLLLFESDYEKAMARAARQAFTNAADALCYLLATEGSK